MRILAVILIALALYLQYAYWFGDGGRREVQRLRRDIALQEAENERLSNRNRTLGAEVMDLKEGMEAIEELARSEIGMVKAGEIFVHLMEYRRPEPETP